MEKDNNLDGGILRRIVDVPPMLNKNEYLDKIVISKDHAKTLMPEEYAYLMNYLIPCIDPITGDVKAMWNNRENSGKFIYIYNMITTTVARFVNSGVLKFMLDLKDDEYIKDEDSNTILHIACMNGDLALTDELINRGYNINRANSLYVTPLHFAAKYNHAKIVRQLLSIGVNIDHKDKYECTPLYYAVEAKAGIEVIKLLLENGSNPHIKGKRNFSPLLLAIYVERVDIVRVMLEYGLKHNKDQYEHARTYAKTIGNKEIIDLFDPPKKSNFVYNFLYYLAVAYEITALIIIFLLFMIFVFG